MQNTEKKCFKCGEVKPLSDFYKHKMMADGHVNKCKDCNKKDVIENRKKNVDYYRDYDRERGARQTSEYQRNYRNEFPMKYAAHRLVSNSIRDGRLSKPDRCEECNKFHDHIHGHHDDYALPLVVRWLCPPCHKAWHDKNGEAKNGR